MTKKSIEDALGYDPVPVMAVFKVPPGLYVSGFPKGSMSREDAVELLTGVVRALSAMTKTDARELVEASMKILRDVKDVPLLETGIEGLENVKTRTPPLKEPH